MKISLSGLVYHQVLRYFPPCGVVFECFVIHILAIYCLTPGSCIPVNIVSPPPPRLVVAGAVGSNEQRSRLTLRHTTLMPNIPALPAILALLFCPVYVSYARF